MPQRDLAHNVGVVHLLDAQSIAADTYSSLLDLKGFEGGMILVNLGAITVGSGAVDVYLQHADVTTGTSFEAVPVADMIDISALGDGTTAGHIALLDADDEDSKTLVVGYKGTKRYIRIFLDENATGITSLLVSVDGLVGFARHRPESSAAPAAVAAT